MPEHGGPPSLTLRTLALPQMPPLTLNQPQALDLPQPQPHHDGGLVQLLAVLQV